MGKGQRRERDSGTREALIDSAEQLMLEQGYAGVSSRRVAAGIGADGALVYYYFDTMDDLFISLFRRIAERSLKRQEAALSTGQPLWGLWRSIYEDVDTALLIEFAAAANHRPSIRTEVATYSKKIRKIQAETIGRAFDRYGIDSSEFPPEAIGLLLAAISRFIVAEEASGVYDGHNQMFDLVHRYLRVFEGEHTPASAGEAD